MNFTHALTRLPGEDFARGITTAGLGKPDFVLCSLVSGFCCSSHRKAAIRFLCNKNVVVVA